MFSSPLVVLSLISVAFATVFTTSPVASSTFTGGQEATISWQDDGSAPSLKDFGPARVSIYVGNAQQQTSLQTIVPSVDVSTTSSIKFTPDASIGPNSAQYFIRFESLSLKDAAAPQFPALAFSAKFTMAGMTGVFTADAQAQIDGQTTAPLGGQSATVAVRPAASATSASSASLTSSKAASSTGSVSGSRTGSAAAASGTANSAMGVRASWIGAIAGAAVGIAMF